MADLETPPSEIPEVPLDINPPVEKKPKRAWNSDADVAVAMISANGNRYKAAVALGISVGRLNTRIADSHTLKTRFGKKAQMLRDEMVVKEIVSTEPGVSSKRILIDKIEELVVGQASVAQIALARLSEIKERITNGNRAKRLLRQGTDLTDAEKKFAELWRFEDGEEKILMAQEVAMIQEYTRSNETATAVTHKRAQTEALFLKMGSGGRKPPTRPPLASPPKGTAPGPAVTQPPKENVNGSSSPAT